MRNYTHLTARKLELNGVCTGGFIKTQITVNFSKTVAPKMLPLQ